MGYRIDAKLFNEQVSDVVNANNTAIKNNIEGFNTNISKLANGVNWTGATAQTVIGQLVEFYNSYISAYSDFVTKLKEKYQFSIEAINGILTSNGGIQLDFGSIDALTFETPKINDVYANGVETGNVIEMRNCALAFTEGAKNIKDGYIAIKTAFVEYVGSGKAALDTTDFGTDYAKHLKDGIVDVIDNLAKVDEEKFKECITNIYTAADNISGN